MIPMGCLARSFPGVNCTRLSGACLGLWCSLADDKDVDKQAPCWLRAWQVADPIRSPNVAPRFRFSNCSVPVFVIMQDISRRVGRNSPTIKGLSQYFHAKGALLLQLKRLSTGPFILHKRSLSSLTLLHRLVG